jgi:hypothetical protein
MRPLRRHHPSLNIGKMNEADRRFRVPPYEIASRLQAGGLRIHTPDSIFRQLIMS